ncbi:MAG: DUF3822 family protein [Bacteroidales bacterium]|nr:DUF3822 family protein [Bacteroidales bacterium]
MSRHTPKVALVPSAFFDPASAREVLSRTVELDQEDKVEYISLPEFSAELVYSLSDEDYPEMYYLLKKLSEIPEYNKILASYGDGVLTLVISQGDNLLLANTFQAADFTTAEYFLFMAVKKLQLNPEVSTVSFMTPLSGEEEMSLYRYFKAVESL